MALLDINWKPTDRQLRQFGCVGLIALPAIAWLWGASQDVLLVLAAIGLCIAAIGLAFPKAIKPLFIGLTLVATPIGLVVAEMMIFLVYASIFFPIGMIFRLMGRDALQLKLDRDRDSYWQGKQQPTDVSSYYRQS